MKRSEYQKRAFDLWASGKITEEVYDAMCMNEDAFCDDDYDDYDDRLPESYAEIEYDDMESAEAVIGSRWDDMNYLHYMER